MVRSKAGQTDLLVALTSILQVLHGPIKYKRDLNKQLADINLKTSLIFTGWRHWFFFNRMFLVALSIQQNFTALSYERKPTNLQSRVIMLQRLSTREEGGAQR